MVPKRKIVLAIAAAASITIAFQNCSSAFRYSVSISDPKLDQTLVTPITLTPSPPDPLELTTFIIMRDRLSPTAYAWQMRIADASTEWGAARAGSPLNGLALSPTERIAALIDLDGDGRKDVVTQEARLNGGNWSEIRYWKSLNDAGTSWAQTKLGQIDGRLQLSGIGPIGTKMYAVYRQHANSPSSELGKIYYQEINANQLVGGHGSLAGAPGIEWRLAGVSDLNRDQTFDLVFHHRKNGQTAIWQLAMTSGVLTRTADYALNIADPNLFYLIGPHELSNKETALLFRELNSGEIKAWILGANFTVKHAANLRFPLSFQFISDIGEIDYKHILREYPSATVNLKPGTLVIDNIPATLDLAERADLALRAMINALEPRDDYNMYWYSRLIGDQPFMVVGSSPAMNAKFMEAMPLMRLMTGNSTNIEVDRKLLTLFARNITPQGIYGMPAREHIEDTYLHQFTVHDVSHDFMILPQARYLSVLSNYYLMTGNHVLPPALTGERLLAGLDSISSKQLVGTANSYYEYYPDRHGQIKGVNRGRLILPELIPWPDLQTWPNQASLEKAWNDLNVPSQVGDSARTIQGPAEYMKRFGNNLSATIAQNYSRWIYQDRSRLFASDGFHAMGSLETRNGLPAPHSAIRTKALNAVLTYAIHANDYAAIQFVNKSYVWLGNHPSTHRLLGYFPEHVFSGNDWEAHAETDEIADMIDMAVKLASHSPNYDYYWYDAERWVRNHFSEMQLTNDKIAAIIAQQNQTQNRGWYKQYNLQRSGASCKATANGPGVEDVYRCQTDQVAEKHLGSWGSYAKPHDWGYTVQTASGPVSKYGVMNCCLASAARTLHVVWDRMLSITGSTVRLNMLLNRAAKELVVHSYLPFSGRVDISVPANQPTRTLEVRIPEWLVNEADKIQFLANGTKLPPVPRLGNYLQLTVSAGTRITMLFPFQENDTSILHRQQNINGVNYSIWQRGYNVIRVIPEDSTIETLVPLYNQYSPYFNATGVFVPPVTNGELPSSLRKDIHRFIVN